jgi:hypothetical protein
MIDMITTALDVGIMTGIVMFIAFGLTLRRDAPRSGPAPWILRVAAALITPLSPYRVYEYTP